jgi:hypothetical protein
LFVAADAVDPAYELLGGLAILKGATDVAYVPLDFSASFESFAGGAINNFVSGAAGNAFLAAPAAGNAFLAAPAAGNAFCPLRGLPPFSILFVWTVVLGRFAAVAFFADVP